jgi:AcrR family transcriptional regulator
MPRLPEENAKIREKTIKKLLDASLELFATEGYHKATMAKIAKLAGVSKGLAFHYFREKSDLLVALAGRRIEEWVPLIEGLNTIENPQDRLRFLVEFVIEELRSKTNILRLYHSLYLTNDGICAIEKAQKTYSELFKKIADQEIRLFEDFKVSDPSFHAMLLRAHLQGISIEYMLEPGSVDLNRLQKFLLQLYGKMRA